MKKLIVIAICVFIGLNAFGQSSPTLEGTEAYYLQKRKSANTIGLIMLGGGVAMTGAEIATTVNNIRPFDENKVKAVYSEAPHYSANAFNKQSFKSV